MNRQDEEESRDAPFEALPHSPNLARVTYPVVEIKDRLIRLELEDEKLLGLELRFQPYQALKLTTSDCFLPPDGARMRADSVLYSRKTAWLGELKSALHVRDYTATFMDHAIHFLIPAGDDVIEIAAWRVEIRYKGEIHVFPDDGEKG